MTPEEQAHHEALSDALERTCAALERLTEKSAAVAALNRDLERRHAIDTETIANLRKQVAELRTRPREIPG